jgi:parallel beta-helix repeat protein
MKRFLFLVVLLWAMPAEAVTRYVDSVACTGNYSIANRSCTGSDGNSYTTVNAALAAMSGGDTLYIRAGTYTAPTAVVPPGKDLGSGATTISRYQSEVVTLNFPSGGSGFLYCPSGAQRYIIINGLIWDGVGKTTGGLNGGCDHIMFTNNTVRNTLRSGFMGADNNTYRGNIIHDNGVESNNSGTLCYTSGCGSPQDHGMYLSGPDNIIEDNEIYSNWGAGIQIHAPGGSYINHRNKIRRNYIHNNGVGQGVAGITVDQAADNEIYSNVITRHNGATGLYIYNTTDRTLIYGNTFYNNTGAPQIQIDPGNANNNAVIRNNILHPGPSGTGALSDGGSGTTYSFNLCSGAGETLSACSFGTSNQSELPSATFTDRANNIYTLKAGSAALDTGTPLVGYATAINGTTRPQGAAWDIGAYETSAAAPACPAVSNALVASYGFEGNGNDSSGVNTATLGSGWSYTTGKYGQGALSTGASGITVADADALDPCGGFTYEAWISIPNTSGDYALINKNPDSASFLFASFTGYCGTGVPIGGYSTATASAVACYGTPVTTGSFQHMAVTYDATLPSDNVKLYLNGSQVTTANGTALLSPTTGTLQFCTSSFGETCPSGTIIDEVRIYNYARTGPQIITDRDTPIIAPSLTPPSLKVSGIMKFGASATALKLRQ